jgi:predicted ArsR family transcriptional regulator
MEQILKITSVLSDPTRFYIYQYITECHHEVTVQEVADQFNIHSNVARHHLARLEDINMLNSKMVKTGKSGRPNKFYRISDDIIQLHFPFRDYMLLAKTAIETIVSLGEEGRKALFLIGKRFGAEMIEQEITKKSISVSKLDFNQKLDILKFASVLAGFYPELKGNQEKTTIYFQIHNCPFKEIAQNHKETVCNMHKEFLKGMVEELFSSVQLIEQGNLITGCNHCGYQLIV